MVDMQLMSDAFQAAAGFSGEDFNNYLKFVFIVLTILWALELFAVWSFQMDIHDIHSLAIRVVGVGVVITIVMILVGS
jgi:hypothetical protein